MVVQGGLIGSLLGGTPTGLCNFYIIVKSESTNTEEIFQVTNVATNSPNYNYPVPVFLGTPSQLQCVTGSQLTLTVVGAQGNTVASNHSVGATIVGSAMTTAAFSQLKTDCWVASCTYGPTAFGNVTGSRALNTVYQNTGTTMKWVIVACNTSSAGTLTLYCDATSSPTTGVGASTTNGAAWVTSVNILVPVNYYYKATCTNSSGLDNWVEWS